MRRPLLLALIAVFFIVPLGSSRAAGDPFTISGIKVDASGASATEAFNVAIADGRRKAWDLLAHRLTREQDWDKIPMVDDVALQRMTRGYQIADEKRSTTRYVADVTFIFDGNLVRRFLRNANVAYTDSAAKPVLVIPMAPSYVQDSDWTKAWTGSAVVNSAVPLILPQGDALDASILAPIGFDTASWDDIQPVASRMRAGQAALVQAGPVSAGHMTVNIRILSPTGQQALPPFDVPVAPDATPQMTDASAVAAAAQAIGNIWKTRAAIDFNQQATLTADVRLDSAAQWGAIQQKLAKVPVVTNVNVVAMDIGQARIVINYAGTQAQLRDFLSQAALELSMRDGQLWLSVQPASGGTGDR